MCSDNIRQFLPFYSLRVRYSHVIVSVDLILSVVLRIPDEHAETFK